MRSITKILIANRGEIAVRIIRACRRMGIVTVAVYSDADRNAMHVRYADEAYHIGESAPAASYLNQNKLIEIARRSGCQAIHPGYGFLAENSTFAKLCRDEGIIFIGPSPEVIALLGDKVASRRTMASAGVPVVPGCDKDGLTDGELALEAAAIGYPIIVKAAAGGGGKGMRVVEHPTKLPDALAAARREAKAAFGDETVFLEKFLIKPRHIEFQIFGDEHGNYLHLFERECSIQRRHQKIIEETPSPALNDELRSRMGDAAVKVAQAANYTGAGTVEFLLDDKLNFYFLEVNTRIQVEHPITEVTLGVDLVKEQIRVAMGERLSWRQDELRQCGHAIECRIYAEDPTANFLPAAGSVLFFKEATGPGIRFDSGVESGDEVSVFYDPIIAKLIAYAENRLLAIQGAVKALDETVILGLTSNREFLKDILEHQAFRAGALHIGFLQEHLPNWQAPAPSDEELIQAIALASSVSGTYGEVNSQPVGVDGHTSGIPEPWQQLGAWRIGAGVHR